MIWSEIGIKQNTCLKTFILKSLVIYFFSRFIPDEDEFVLNIFAWQAAICQPLLFRIGLIFFGVGNGKFLKLSS